MTTSLGIKNLYIMCLEINSFSPKLPSIDMQPEFEEEKHKISVTLSFVLLN